MFLAILKTSGLMLATGPALFLLVCANSTCDGALHNDLYRKSVRLSITGVVFYVCSVLVNFVFDNRLLLTNIESINFVLLPVFVILFTRQKLPAARPLAGLMSILALLIFFLHGAQSHTGSDSGAYPYMGLVVHLAATSAWSGGILLLTYKFVSARFKYEQVVAGMTRHLYLRFFKFTILLLFLLLITGSILMVNNIHDNSVINFTEYGRHLKYKLYMVFAITCLLIVGVIRSRKPVRVETVEEPGSASGPGKGHTRISLLQLLIIVPIIAISAMLTRMDPPSIAPFINPQSRHLQIEGQDVRVDMQPVAGSITGVRFEVYLPDQLNQLSPVSMNYDFYLPRRQIGVFGDEVIQVSQNSFQGETSFPVPGNWQLDIYISVPDGSVLSGSTIFELPSQPLVDDITTYLSFSSISYNTSNKITFLVGMALILVYGWLFRKLQPEKMPVFVTLTGLSGLSLGIYMVLSVSLVRTYPSTFWDNPQVYSAESISAGTTEYLQYCAECHGDSGGGDGPWSLENRGRIPDLASLHMDIHTDGEIYWWITRGIPSLDMPPLEEEISKPDRWNIINYVRSLRHGVP